MGRCPKRIPPASLIAHVLDTACRVSEGKGTIRRRKAIRVPPVGSSLEFKCGAVRDERDGAVLAAVVIANDGATGLPRLIAR
jgi:hypothetical protein